MTGWRKRLARLLADPRPVGYSYDDVAGLLSRLGFVLRPSRGGSSHRKWRLDRPNRPSVWIGLVEGHGALPPGYVREVQATLTREGLVHGEDKEMRDDALDN
jgi:hypothetical protein